MIRLLTCLLVASLFTPAGATPPPDSPESPNRPEGANPPDSGEILKALHRDQLAARDALEELRRTPLAEQHTDRVMHALDQFWAQTGRAHLSRAVNLTAAEVKALGIDDGPIGLLWGELKAVVGSTYDIQQVVQRFLDKARPIIEGMVDQHMSRLRADLDTTITATLAAEMSALQGAFDDEVAARFPAWTAALVVPVLPTPDAEMDALVVTDALADKRSGRWGLRAGLVAVPAVAGLAGTVGRSLSRRAAKRAVRAVGRRVAGRLAASLTGIGAFLAAADTLADVLTIKNRYKEEMVMAVTTGLREGLRAERIWQTPMGDNPSPRADVRRRVETKLNEWTDAALRRSLEVVEAAPALRAPGAEAFVGKAMEAGADRDAVLKRLGALQRAFGPRMLAQHPIALLDEMTAHADHTTLATLSDRLGDTLVTRYKNHGGAFLKAAQRVGPTLMVELLQDPKSDWRAIASAIPPGADIQAARGHLVCARLGVQCAELGLDAPEAARLGTRGELALQLFEAGLPAREAVATALDRTAQAGAEALLKEGELLVDLGAALGPQRLARLGRDAALVPALAQVYRFEEEAGRWLRADRVRHLDDALIRAPIARRHGTDGLAVFAAAIEGGGERKRAEARRAVDLLERVDAAVLLDADARRLLLDHADSAYGGLVISLLRWTGPGGTLVVKGVLLGALIIPLWLLLRMFGLGRRRRR